MGAHWGGHTAGRPAKARSAGHGAKAGQEALAKRDGSPYQVDFSAHAVYATAHDYLVVAT